MKNNLQIETPYNICKTITSQFALDIKKDHLYLFHIDLNYLNDTRLIEVSILIDILQLTNIKSQLLIVKKIYSLFM